MPNFVASASIGLVENPVARLERVTLRTHRSIGGNRRAIPLRELALGQQVSSRGQIEPTGAIRGP